MPDITPLSPQGATPNEATVVIQFEPTNPTLIMVTSEAVAALRTAGVCLTLDVPKETARAASPETGPGAEGYSNLGLAGGPQLSAERKYVGTVGELRAAYATLPDDAPLLAQVVAEDGMCWRVFPSTALGRDCGFRWNVNPAILTLTHPELTTLPSAAVAASVAPQEPIGEAARCECGHRYGLHTATGVCVGGDHESLNNECGCQQYRARRRSTGDAAPTEGKA